MENHGRDPKFELPTVSHPPLTPDLCDICEHTIAGHDPIRGDCRSYLCGCVLIRKDPTSQDDPVNHPAHYTAYKGLEIIDLTEQMNFNRGNAVKYIARAGLKNPETELEDLEKARWYISREIERLKKNPDDIP